MGTKTEFVDKIVSREKDLLDDWMKEQLAAVTLRTDLLSEADLRRQSTELLSAFIESIRPGIPQDIKAPECQHLVGILRDITRMRLEQGFSVSEVATFVLSLKQPIFRVLYDKDTTASAEQLWHMGTYIDRLGLHCTELYQKGREGIIARQQQELLELSTPVVELWEGVVALPLIGTLDSARTQVVMESLLQKLVDTNATMAIIDITGVPTVDTSVAKHLIKTVTAARLMGADCLISGVRPAIALTIVHLGVDLSEITTKATLADALDVCLRRNGFAITRVDQK